MDKLEQYLKIMELNKSFTLEELNKKYRILSKKFHPDRHSRNELQQLAEEKQKEINEAYSYLKDYIKSKNNSDHNDKTADNQSQTESDDINDCFMTNKKSEILYIEEILKVISNYNSNFEELCLTYLNNIKDISDLNFVNEIMLKEEFSYLQKFFENLKENSLDFFTNNALFFNYIKECEKNFILKNIYKISEIKLKYIYEYSQFFLKYNHEFFCNVLLLRYDIFCKKMQKIVDATIEKYELVKYNIVNAGVSYQKSKTEIEMYFKIDLAREIEKTLTSSIFLGLNSDEIEKIFEETLKDFQYLFNPNYRLNSIEINFQNLKTLSTDFCEEKNNFLIETYSYLIFGQNFEKAKEIYKSGSIEKNDYFNTIAKKLFFSTDEEIISNKVIDKLNFIFLVDMREAIKKDLESQYQKLNDFDMYQYLKKNPNINYGSDFTFLIPKWIEKDYKNFLLFITHIKNCADNSFKKSHLSEDSEYFKKIEEKFYNKISNIKKNTLNLKEFIQYLECASKITELTNLLENKQSITLNQIIKNKEEISKYTHIFCEYNRALGKISDFLHSRNFDKKQNITSEIILEKEEELTKNNEILVDQISKVSTNKNWRQMYALLEAESKKLQIKLYRTEALNSIAGDIKYTLGIIIAILYFTDITFLSILNHPIELLLVATIKVIFYKKLLNKYDIIKNKLDSINKNKEIIKIFFSECSYFIEEIELLYPEKKFDFLQNDSSKKGDDFKIQEKNKSSLKFISKNLIWGIFVLMIVVAGFFFFKNKSQNSNITTSESNSSILELKDYINEKDGFSIDYPIGIFSVSERTEEEMSGTIFKSEDESLNMSIFRWLPKLGEDFNLEDSYLDTKEVIEKEPTGKITYTYFANNLFTISYQLEGRLNHIKVIYDRINQQTVTLLISYENKHTASMQPIINNILDSFKVESPVYTQKTSTVPNDNLSNEKKAIYMQSSENIQYETYNNPRFNFSVDYPTKYFEFLPDSANGDGKSMISEDSGVYLSFSAVYNVLDTTIEEEYQKELESIDTVEYKNLGNKSYSLSYYGEHGEIVFVKKTYDEIDNKYITLYFKYDEKYKNFMTPIINKMTNSVKTNTKN